MSNVPGVSSYDKIFQHLVETPEFKDLRARWLDRISKMGEVSYKLATERNYAPGAKLDNTVVSFETTGPVTVSVGFNDERVYVSLNDLVSDEEIMHVVDKNWGTPLCRTYFCDKDVFVTGKKKLKPLPPLATGAKTRARDEGRRPKEVFDKFTRRVRGLLYMESEKEIQALKDRLGESMKSTLDSPEYKAAFKRFGDLRAIGEIKAVILKYLDHVSPEVLKEALDSAAVESILCS